MEKYFGIFSLAEEKSPFFCADLEISTVFTKQNLRVGGFPLLKNGFSLFTLDPVIQFSPEWYCQMRNFARNPNMPNKAAVFSLDKKLDEKKLLSPRKKCPIFFSGSSFERGFFLEIFKNS